MRRILALLALVVGVLAVGTAANAQTADNQVTVIHGIPDTDVDVYVNDDLTLDDFEFGTVTDELPLPAGDYNIKIRAADADADGEVLLEGDVSLPGGANATVIAHLDADGNPALSPFVNDTSETDAGQGRLIVRHTAAAPTVDVLAGGDVVFDGISNPDEASADLPADTYSASVAAAGTTDPVIGPADVPVAEGQATIVYAVGSLEADNLQVLVQTVDGLHSAPASVPSGDSGLLASSGINLAAAALLGAGILGLGGTAALAVRRTR